MEEKEEELLNKYYEELKTLVNEDELLDFKYEIRKDYLDNRRKRKNDVDIKINDVLSRINKDLENVEQISINKLFNVLLTMDSTKYPLINQFIEKYEYLDKFNIYYNNIEYRLLKNMKMSDADKDTLATKILINSDNYNYQPVYDKIIQRLLLREDIPLEYDNLKKMFVLFTNKYIKSISSDAKCLIKDQRPKETLGSSISTCIFLYDDVIKEFYNYSNPAILFTIFHELTHIRQFKRIKDKKELSLLNILELKDYILSRRLKDYYNDNYDNITYECEAEYIGILKTLDYFKNLKVDFKSKVKYLKSAEEKKQNLSNFKRKLLGNDSSLTVLFDAFIKRHPEIVKENPLLSYEYIIENDKVFHKTNEEMKQELEDILLKEDIDLEEKEKIKDFYSCFITEKSRNS